jgi:hypothetical protein
LTLGGLGVVDSTGSFSQDVVAAAGSAGRLGGLIDASGSAGTSDRDRRVGAEISGTEGAGGMAGLGGGGLAGLGGSATTAGRGRSGATATGACRENGTCVAYCMAEWW